MGPRVTKSLSPADRELADFVATFYADPLGFVQACYPWEEPGPLQPYDGPDTWQREFLTKVGDQVRANAFSSSAVAKLEAAGGSAEVIEPKPR